jgi:hypothetical protein
VCLFAAGTAGSWPLSWSSAWRRAVVGWLAVSQARQTLVDAAGKRMQVTAANAGDAIDRNLFERYGDDRITLPFTAPIYDPDGTMVGHDRLGRGGADGGHGRDKPQCVARRRRHR